MSHIPRRMAGAPTPARLLSAPAQARSLSPRMGFRPKGYRGTNHLAGSLNVRTETVRTAQRGRLVMSKALVLGGAALALSAASASAQVYVSPGYGYGYGYGAPLYDQAAPVADLAPPAYGYAAPTP